MQRLALAAAGAVLVGLTSCSPSAAPSASPPTSHRTPVSCSAQYRTWSTSEGKGVMGTLHGVSTAATVSNKKARAAMLQQAKPAVERATRHPIPACVDPRGYWSVLLMHLSAAVAGTGTPSSVQAALRDVPRIHRQLLAEVREAAQ